MQIVEVYVLDGRGPIRVAVATAEEADRLRAYVRDANSMFREIATEGGRNEA
jgi:redox-regulated HSP33 family molecular chaperone